MQSSIHESLANGAVRKARERLDEVFKMRETQAAGGLRSSTPPTLSLLLLLHASVRAFTPNARHAPISVENLFSVTLLPIHPAGQLCSDVGRVLVPISR